jgi:S1-C subfamily serine protease
MKLLSWIAITLLPISAVAQAKAQGPPRKDTNPALSPQEVFRRVSPSVFVVESLNSKDEVLASGSGVVVRLPTMARQRDADVTSGPVVVTNKHVIYGAVAYRIRKGEKSWKATLARLDQGHDLCALQPETGWTAKPIAVRVSSSVKVGERTYTIGAPEGLELSLSEGLVSGLREVDDVRVIQTSAPISPGSSGGGLFDSEGRLIGVTTFFLKEGQNLNFALPGEWILGLGDESAAHFPASASGSQLEEAKKWSHKGLMASLNKNYGVAVDSYKESVRLDPEDSTAWFGLGKAQQELNRDEEAVNSFQQAARLKSDDFTSGMWMRIEIAYIKLRRYEEANDAANHAMFLDTHTVLPWALLARAYLQAGKCKEAVNTYQMMLLFFPDDRDVQALSKKLRIKCKSQ